MAARGWHEVTFVRPAYYPYGQEIGTVTENDTAKFGTYTRDAATGLDYAMNRYYQSTWGRFTSPDPYRASGGPGDPGSWNRYTYTRGDPVNRYDPAGLLDYDASVIVWMPSRTVTSTTEFGSTGRDGKDVFMPVMGDGWDGGGGGGSSGSLGDKAVGAFAVAAQNLQLLKPDALPTPCKDLLSKLEAMSNGKITLDSIIDAAGKIVAYDGTDKNGLAGTMDYNDMFRNSDNYLPGNMAGFKVSDYFDKRKGTSALTMLGLNQIGLAVVFLRPTIINTYSAAYMASLVMHEVLHSLGFEDTPIMAALGVKRPDKVASKYITDAFAKDCFGVSK